MADGGLGDAETAGITIGALVVVYLLWRCYYLRQPGMRAAFFFREFPLVAKETLVEPTGGSAGTYGATGAGSDTSATPRLAVHRLTFLLPPGTQLGANLGLGEYVRIKAPGGSKCGRGSGPKSYSPTCEYAFKDIPSGREIGPAAADAQPDQRVFDLVVKVYPGGRTSTHLGNLALGDECLISAPYPPWHMQVRRNKGPRVAIVALGVGITEALPVATSELQDSSVEAVVLLWGNRTEAETFFAKELNALLRHPKFRLVHALSREKAPDGASDGSASGKADAAASAPAATASSGTTTADSSEPDKRVGGSRLYGQRISPAMLQQVFAHDGPEAWRVLCVGTRRQRRDLLHMFATAGLPHAKLLRKRPGPRSCC